MRPPVAAHLSCPAAAPASLYFLYTFMQFLYLEFVFVTPLGIRFPLLCFLVASGLSIFQFTLQFPNDGRLVFRPL